jgi:hypothetical protein
LLSHAGPWNSNEILGNLRSEVENNNRNDNGNSNSNQLNSENNGTKNLIEEFPLEKLPTNEGFDDETQFEELKIEGEDLTNNNLGGNVNN